MSQGQAFYDDFFFLNNAKDGYEMVLHFTVMTNSVHGFSL